MNFQNYLKTAALEINQELELFLKKWHQEVLKLTPKVSDLNKSFIEANSGGKRLRGTLVKLGYEIAYGKLLMANRRKEILKPAIAYEIFQTAILAHDDIVDLSPTRRGKPTIYKALGGDHYGISQTICLGDIGFFLSMRLILNSNFEEKRKNEGARIFTEMVISTGLGEILDIELPHLGGERREKDVLVVHKLKSAYYTIVYPLSLGVVLAKDNQELLRQIKKLGEVLGIAFQIQDDILGVFGDKKTLGKSVTSDIEEGKNTLLIIQAFKNANQKQKEILKKYYGKGKIGAREFKQIKKVFIETAALEYSQNKAERLVNQAQKIIKEMEISKNHKNLLSQMADYLVKRDK